MHHRLSSLAVVAVLVLPPAVQAQTLDPEPQPTRSLSWGLGARSGGVEGANAVFVTASAGVELGRGHYVGAVGSVLTSGRLSQPTTPLRQLSMGYGGLRWVEDAWSLGSRARVTFGTVVGVGVARWSDRGSSVGSTPTDAFVVLEPELALDAGLTRRLRLSLLVSHRSLTLLSLPDLPMDRLEGVTAGVALRIGRF